MNKVKKTQLEKDCFYHIDLHSDLKSQVTQSKLNELSIVVKRLLVKNNKKLSLYLFEDNSQ